MTVKRILSRLLLPAFAVAVFVSFLIYRRSLPPDAPGPLPSPGEGATFLPLENGGAFLPPTLDLTPRPSPDGEPSGAAPSEPSETSEPSQKPNDLLTLSFAGDCMLATIRGESGPDTLNYEMARQDPAFFFKYLAPYFQEDDFSFVNCENVFTDSALAPVAKNYSPAYWYRSPAKNAGIFRAAGIEGVSVCNNHAGDYGEQGYADTLAALESAGILYGQSGAPLVIDLRGLQIGIVCANLYGSSQTDKILRQVEQLRERCGYIIVYFHGGTERIHEPEEWKIAACRQIAEAGADLILGCHPHVLQRSEIIPRKDGRTALVVYSLGNFLFGGGRSEENRTALVRLHLTLSEGKAVDHRLEFIPCYVYATKDRSSPECWIPRPMEEGEARDRVLAFLRGETDSPM